MHEGKLAEAVDAFAHPLWDRVRDTLSHEAIAMRRQGFDGAARLPMSEPEYAGVMEKLAELNSRFQARRAD